MKRIAVALLLLASPAAAEMTAAEVAAFCIKAQSEFHWESKNLPRDEFKKKACLAFHAVGIARGTPAQDVCNDVSAEYADHWRRVIGVKPGGQMNCH